MTREQLLECAGELYKLAVHNADEKTAAACVRAALAVLEFIAAVEGHVTQRVPEPISADPRTPEQLAAQVLRSVADACRVLGQPVPDGLPSEDAEPTE